MAHPGHELRLFGWVKRNAPITYVMTDGSGRTGKSRLNSTIDLLAGLHTTNGKPELAANLHVVTDLTIYENLLQADATLFIHLAQRIATDFLQELPRSVVTDAAEGYNPTHDVCHAIAAAAVLRVQRETGKVIPLRQTILAGHPAQIPAGMTEVERLELNDVEFAEKINSAKQYLALAAEFGRAVEMFGVEAFRTEVLLEAPLEQAFAPPSESPPYYEKFGAEQHAKGIYKDVLRYAQHVRPIVEKLRQFGETAKP